VIFELDGDTNLSQVDHSAKVKISKCGKIIKRFTTVPEENFDDIALIDGVGIVDENNPLKDEDIANLQAYLDNLKEDVDIDETGTYHWELREEIHLPLGAAAAPPTKKKMLAPRAAQEPPLAPAPPRRTKTLAPLKTPCPPKPSCRCRQRFQRREFQLRAKEKGKPSKKKNIQSSNRNSTQSGPSKRG
jgi:hypothetical protein